MNEDILGNKINLLRKILILFYEIEYTKQAHEELIEYWVIKPHQTVGCKMLNRVIEMEDDFVNGISISPDEMIEMNEYYKACLISTKVRKFLHYDKKS